MLGKLVIIIVGVSLILVALIGSLRKKSAINTQIAVVLGVIGVLLTIYGTYSSELGFYNTQIEQVSTGNKLQIKGPVDAVKVISPVEGDSVNCRILTMGVYPKSHKKDIWVALRPTDDRYYPNLIILIRLTKEKESGK